MAESTSRLRRKLKTNDVLSIIAASNGSDDDGDTPVSVTSSDGWEPVPLEDLIGREIENEEFTPVEIGLQSFDGLSSVVGQALQTIVSQTSDDDLLSEKTYGNDSDGDPDFKLTDESSTSSHTEEETEVDLVNDSKILKRHKRPAENTWKMNVPKHKRLSGEMYTNRKDVDKPARAIGTPCSSGYCSKSKFRDCQTMSEDERLWVFNKFWSMNSWEERKIYVETLVTKVAIKQKKSGLQSRRKCSYIYQLQIEDGTKYNVCKRLFSSTLGIPERTIFLWVDDTQSKEKKAMKTPKTGPKTPVSDSDLDFVKRWLSDLPHVPSHYCRNTSTYENKKFLYPGTSIANLHREYHKVAELHSMRVISMTVFNEVFHKENFSVFIPRKDQCNVCISYNQGNLTRDMYDAHIDAKNLARAEKNSDKEAANDKKSVWTVDLQAVLLCPKTKAGAMFYKTKLQVHNFTFYNLQTHDGYCYVWDESEGDLRSDVFAHLQYNHFQKVIDNNGMLEEIIIWSDGCGYQNRNTSVSNVFIELANKTGVTIIQKYLCSGHSQMECDSMHSCIERKIVCDVYTPSDYVLLMKMARQKPSQYHVKQIFHNELYKLSGSYLSSIRPGRKVGDPTVHDLRALKYQRNARVQYKLRFAHTTNWECLPQRWIAPNEPYEWVRLFQSRLPITLRKFTDLQSMKHVLPQSSYQYFDNLPHTET